VLLLLNKKKYVARTSMFQKKVRKKVDKRRLLAVDDDTVSHVFLIEFADMINKNADVYVYEHIECGKLSSNASLVPLTSSNS